MKVDNYIQYRSANNSIAFQQNLYRISKAAAKERYIADRSNYISNLSQLSFQKVKEAIQNVPKEKINFLDSLATLFNATNFGKKLDKINPDNEFILKIFNSIEKPNKYHYGIINNAKSNFENLSKVFEEIDDDKTLAAVYKYFKHIARERENSTGLILDILHSSIKPDFVKNFDNYKSYFKLNFRNPNAVKDLEKLIAENKFSSKKFDIKYAVKKLSEMSRISDNPNIKTKDLEAGYSRESKEFIETFLKQYYPLRTKIDLPKINTENLMKMYASTNSSNTSIRSSLMYRYSDAPKQDAKGNDLVQKEIAQMAKLFDRIDNDKNAREFISKMIEDNINAVSFEHINTILDKFDSKALNIYYSNINKFLNNSNIDDTINLIEKSMHNPFYETETMRYNRKMMEEYAFRSKLTSFEKWMLRVQQKINDYKYKHSPDTSYTPKDFDYDIIPTKIESEIEQPIIAKSAKPQFAQINIEPLEETLNHVEDTPTDKKLVDYLKQISPSKQRKFKVISDIKEVLNKNLTKPMLSKQEQEFEKKATKMRLTLLPDIFESIKVTRKTLRDNGQTKNLPSKKDALTLYKLINGKNRKLVRYMLNKTNSDGTRVFDIRDIIKTIQRAESDIEHFKKTSVVIPFRPADAKAYYDLIYEENIIKYGKLPPKKRVHKKS